MTLKKRLEQTMEWIGDYVLPVLTILLCAVVAYLFVLMVIADYEYATRGTAHQTEVTK